MCFNISEIWATLDMLVASDRVCYIDLMEMINDNFILQPNFQPQFASQTWLGLALTSLTNSLLLEPELDN